MTPRIPVSLLGTAEINTGTIEESEVDAVVKNVRYKARPVLHVPRGSAGDLPSLQEGLNIAASATASVRVSVGPKFVAVDSAASAGGRAKS